MYRSLLYSIIGLLHFVAFSQEFDPKSCTQCDREKDESLRMEAREIDPGFKAIDDYRRKSYDFYSSLLKISTPTTISPPFMDLRKTYNGPDKKPFLLNADIRTPIGLGGYRWGLTSVHVIPQFKVRIFRDDDSFQKDNSYVPADRSSPVRTPSYLPRITVFKTFKNWWYTGDETKSKYVGLSFFHHSNGQDGDELIPGDGRINLYNGNFGEQLVFEVHYGRIVEGDTCRESRFFKPKMTSARKKKNNKLIYERSGLHVTRYQKLGLELHHPDILTNKDFDSLDVYGRTRLNLELGWLFSPYYKDKVYSEKMADQGEGWLVMGCPERREALRWILDISYILDPRYKLMEGAVTERISVLHLRRLNISNTWYWRIPGTPSSALFLQLAYQGSDPYNIYFKTSNLILRGGLALASFSIVK